MPGAFPSCPPRPWHLPSRKTPHFHGWKPEFHSPVRGNGQKSGWIPCNYTKIAATYRDGEVAANIMHLNKDLTLQNLNVF